jgi:hypothetical protein
VEKLGPGERLELANRLYREFYGRCFWYCRPELVITEEFIPLVVRGLRTHGGRRGFLRAEQVLHGRAVIGCDDVTIRFFPAQPDADFGDGLHPADLAVNKVLALVGAAQIRNFLDVLYLDQRYLSVGALAWAACGKDIAYTPRFLLDQINRHSAFREADLRGENLTRPVDLRELKMQWLAARERAEELCARLPAEELGCLYLDANKQPVTPDPGDVGFASLKRHRGSVRGVPPEIN